MYIIFSACHNTKAEINMPELGCELTSMLTKTVCSSRSTALKAFQFTQAVCGGARTYSVLTAKPLLSTILQCLSAMKGNILLSHNMYLTQKAYLTSKVIPQLLSLTRKPI